MKLILQRVISASVDVNGVPHAAIGPGLVVLVGLIAGDTDEHAAWCAEKLTSIRIFEDAKGKMNLSLAEMASAPDATGDAPTDAPGNAGVLLIPNFTLAADASHGRRPSFDSAMKPDLAGPMFDRFVASVRTHLSGAPVRVMSGVFRSSMRVALVNDGPVTIILDSRAPELQPAKQPPLTREQWLAMGAALGINNSM